MTAADLAKRGEAHARAGLKCTPHDCQAVDDEIFAFVRSLAPEKRRGVYAILRGAFNDAWQQEHFKMVSSE